MKELTIEEKAKAYDEALKRAREWHNDSHITIGLKGNLEDIFPELKESEDEKIRKNIIATIHLYYGEPLEDEAKEMIAWLENQGEQKHVNKVEPKFHEGDWVVLSTSDGEKVVQIDSIEYFKSGEPMYITSEGRWFGNGTKAHLWTIQDAKDGDVLACPLPKGYEAREQIFIFKGINSRDYVENCIEYYCRICDGVFYVNENGYMGTTSSPLYPATKSQRDTLFAKMKEAGFEWDSEKKELKKISQHMISAEAKEAMYDKPTDNDMVEALRTEYEKGRADVLRCIDPDVMVADFCSQPLSKTRSIASIYRQGIIDILKRINRNEETSITSNHGIDDVGL